jgi:hypothetical protein
MHCRKIRKEHAKKTGKCLFESSTYERESRSYNSTFEGEVLLQIAGTSGRALIGSERTAPHTRYVEAMDDVDTVEVALKRRTKGGPDGPHS